MAEEDSIPRNPIQAIGPCGFMVLLFLLWYNWKSPGKEAAALMGVSVMVITWLVYMGASYSGEGSKLHGLKPITRSLPDQNDMDLVDSDCLFRDDQRCDLRVG